MEEEKIRRTSVLDIIAIIAFIILLPVVLCVIFLLVIIFLVIQLLPQGDKYETTRRK